jgi:integrase
VKLTQRAIDAFKPGERRFVWDDELSGFGVRITEGMVAYVVDFRLGARRRRVALGSRGEMNVLQARERAQEILFEAKRGKDVTVELSKGMPTFEQVWRRMIDDVDKLTLSPATIKDYEDRAARLILPKLGDKLVGEVTEADVDRAVAATTGQRNRDYIAALIKKTVNFAKRERVLPDSHRNPATNVVLKRTKSIKGKAIEEADIAAFGKALAAMESEGKASPWLANLLRLSLVCGLRPGEVRTLKWSAVNLPKRRMTVVGKTGGREIHLSDAAVTILETTPRVQGCEYVFAGRRFGEPIVAVYKGLHDVQTRAGIDRFRPYDLRHTAATGALASGADVRAVQALLGHADLATTAGYLHASDQRRKDAAEHAARFGRSVLK